MKIPKKLGNKAFSHVEIFLVIILLMAIVGTYFLIRPHADTTNNGVLPPSDVQLDANVPGSVYISWSDSPSPNVSEYEVLRNNVDIGTTPNNYLIDTSVQPDTAYQYSVVAINSANTYSEPSLPLSLTSADSQTLGNPNYESSLTSFSPNESTNNVNSAASAATNTNKSEEKATNWSGYVVFSNSVNFTSVVSTVKVPDVTDCTVAGSTVGIWVGLGGLEQNEGLEQNGIAQQCNQNNHGQLVSTYWAWSEMVPANQVIIPLAVRANQNIVLQTSSPYAGDFSFYFKNLATKKKYTKSYTCAAGVDCGLNSGEWIVERTADCLNKSCTKTKLSPLSDFDTTEVLNASLAYNYQKAMPLGSYPNNYIDMVSSSNHKVYLDKTSHPLSTKATSFFVTWLKSE